MIYTEILDSDKLLLKNNTCAIKTKIIVKPRNESEEEIVLTEDNSVKDWTYDDDRLVPDQGFVGQFVARTLTGNLQDISEDFNIEDRALELRLAIVSLGENPTENWYSLGTFYVTKPENNDVSDNTKFESLDKTILFNADFNYNYVSTNFPTSFATLCETNVGITAINLAKYVCEQVGVTFGTTSFVNDDFLISSNQFVSGDSCRDVMKAIAQLAYSWVCIDWDDKCYIPAIEKDTTAVTNIDTIDSDEYFTLTLQKTNYGPVNKVSVGLSTVDGERVENTDTSSIQQHGETEIDVFDNPITYNTSLRSQAIEGSNILFGIEFTPLNVETIGHPWVKGYKLICVEDTSGNKKYTLPLNNEIKYTGHIRSVISSVIDTKTENTKGYNKKLYKDLQNVYIELDKQQGTITEVVSKTKALDDGLSSLETLVKNTTTDTYTKTEINEIISGTSPDGTVVSSVKTTAGTLDKDGLTIEQTDADTKTNINANGMIIYDATGGIEDALLTVNKDGVIAKNIRVNTYLNIGQHSRIEDYTSPDYIEGTGVFWIGGE
jgi:hypothetical protein|nr:MAG TPA: hypothetical protein [Caudoviricetes sp.]